MGKPFYDAENYGARGSIGCMIRRINNVMVPQAEARFADQELTFSHWIALMSLRDGISATCADLSRHMNYDSGAVTRLVDQLEQRGLVERARSTSDRRVVHISLTKDGKAVARSMTPPVVAYWNEMLVGFSRAESALLVDLLSRLLARMEVEPAKVRAA